MFFSWRTGARRGYWLWPVKQLESGAGKPGVWVPIWVVHMKGGKMGRRGLNREEGMGFGPQGLQVSLKDRWWWWCSVMDSAMPQIAAHQAPPSFTLSWSWLSFMSIKSGETRLIWEYRYGGPPTGESSVSSQAGIETCGGWAWVRGVCGGLEITQCWMMDGAEAECGRGSNWCFCWGSWPSGCWERAWWVLCILGRR